MADAINILPILLINVVNGISSLFLLCIGLAVIFGMMKIVNLAHGEFVMLGAYAAVTSNKLGVNIWLAMLVFAPLFVAFVGFIAERCVIRFLYGRLVESMLATWGLSLLIVGIVTTVFGNTVQGIPMPLGSFSVGEYRASYYTPFLALVSIFVFILIYVVLLHTRFGLISRAAMQNPAMAGALGVNPDRIYMRTFVAGAALTGLAGGLLAPIAGVTPTMGVAYIAKAFITVIGGGATVLAGPLSASVLFGFIVQIGSYLTTPVLGEVILFVCAILLIRAFPQGISRHWFKRGL